MKLHFQRDLDAARREASRLLERQPLLRQRAAIFRAVRRYLDDLDFLEVATPVRLPCPALEEYIEAEPAGRQWLRTSPELHMKRLLVAGYPKIYQIGPCFRRGECGRRHQPEFTMLEWYRLHGDWIQLQQDVIGLVRAAAMAAGTRTPCFRGENVDLFAAWEQISVTEAFRRFAGVELEQALADERFEQILVEQVEPHLGHRRPTFLTHYPLACSGLSKPLPDRPDLVERWELYVGGLELANACSELVDPTEQERRFQKCAELRHCEDRPVYPMDQDFMDALWMGMPEAAGIAVGLDRLVMVLTGAETIADVIAFPVDYCG